MKSARAQSVRLITAVPGPISQQLLLRRDAAVPRGLSTALPIFIKRAEGAVIEDVDGNCFLDFAGGIGCQNAGHRPPEVVAALKQQIDAYLHMCFTVTPYEGYVRLAEILNARTPGNFPKKTLLVNSGAEAVENAIKIARAYTGRQAVIAFEDAFHGRTLLALTLTSKIHPYKAGFGPYAPEIYRLPYAYCYRCSYHLSYPSCDVECANRLEDAFLRRIGAKSVAAVIFEPVLGEGGFVVPPAQWFQRIADICRRHSIIMIADEIQTGFARTGPAFACETFGIEPDLILSAKSISGGTPLAAVTGRAEIMDSLDPGALGGTFGGNPLSCAAAIAAWETFDREDLPARAAAFSSCFQQRTSKWKDRFRTIGEIRGIGAMQAVEFVKDSVSREPAPELTKHLLLLCYQHGLLIISAGTYGNVIRFLAPLVATEEQIEEGLSILENVMEEANA